MAILRFEVLFWPGYATDDVKTHWPLCAVTGEFPAQMTSNAEIFPFDDVIMTSQLRVINILSKHPDCYSLARSRHQIVHETQ